jgi:hypothetical protein
MRLDNGIPFRTPVLQGRIAVAAIAASALELAVKFAVPTSIPWIIKQGICNASVSISNVAARLPRHPENGGVKPPLRYRD